jgi:hypothetical protein
VPWKLGPGSLPPASARKALLSGREQLCRIGPRVCPARVTKLVPHQADL